MLLRPSLRPAVGCYAALIRVGDPSQCLNHWHLNTIVPRTQHEF